MNSLPNYIQVSCSSGTTRLLGMEFNRTILMLILIPMLLSTLAVAICTNHYILYLVEDASIDSVGSILAYHNKILIRVRNIRL